MSAIIVYLCIGFMIMEVACNPSNPNAWREGAQKQYRRKRDRIAYMVMCILIWPVIIIGALLVIMKGEK